MPSSLRISYPGMVGHDGSGPPGWVVRVSFTGASPQVRAASDWATHWAGHTGYVRCFFVRTGRPSRHLMMCPIFAGCPRWPAALGEPVAQLEQLLQETVGVLPHLSINAGMRSSNFCPAPLPVLAMESLPARLFRVLIIVPCRGQEPCCVDRFAFSGAARVPGRRGSGPGLALTTA